MALRSLVVSLEARTAAFEAALNRADRSIKNFENQIAKIGRVTAAVATAGGVALAAKKLFELGAAAEDVRDRFETTFGASAESVTRFARQFGAMAGMSQRATQEMLAGLGATTQAMGFAEGESARLAETVARLAGDLAEFRGRDTAVTVQDLTAALAGQTRGLKQYGIVIDEADVRQRALEQSGKAVAATLTDQERAAATLTLITERMGKATGELARSQDEAQNRAARLRAQWQDIADDFAVKMLPALEKMLPALQALIGPMAKLADLAGQFSNGLTQLFESPANVAILRAAETASLAGLGDRAMPGAMRRFGGEIAGRQTELAVQNALRAQGHLAADVEIRRLENEIALYNDLIAEALRRIAAGIAPAAAASGVGSEGRFMLARSMAEGMLPVGDVFGPRTLGFNLTGSQGRGSRIGMHRGLAGGLERGNPFQFMLDLAEGPSDALMEVYQRQVRAMQGAQEASILFIGSIGAAAQAMIRGGQQIEQAVIAMVAQIAQAVIQARIAALSASGQSVGSLPLVGTVIGAGLGILGALFGGRREPIPVRVDEFSERAQLQQREAIGELVIDLRGSAFDINNIHHRERLESLMALDRERRVVLRYV